MERFALKLADGRALDVAVAGAGHGTVVFHSGTPIAGVPYLPFVDAARQRGARLVHYSRPGYAGSTRMPGRSVADCVADVTAVLDHLGVERAATVGWSGGGPHALACAALLPGRITAAATLAGVAPFDAEGLEFLAGMGGENLDEFGAARAGSAPLVAYLEREAAGLQDITPDAVSAALGDLVDHVDRGSLSGPFADWFAGAVREAVRTGIWGWHDDDLAFVRPWGFALDSIRVPATIWQGAHDRMVPFAHGEWLAAHVAGARPRLLPEHGHLSLVVDSFGRILDELLAV